MVGKYHRKTFINHFKSILIGCLLRLHITQVNHEEQHAQYEETRLEVALRLEVGARKSEQKSAQLENGGVGTNCSIVVSI